MAETDRFDPTGYLQFDLGEGAVRTKAGDRVLVLSDTVVSPLVSAAVETGDLTAVRELGKHLGSQIVDSLGGSVLDDSPEAVLEHAAGVLAVLGWGRLGLERWGNAMVATVDNPPELDGENLGVAALLGGVFSALADAEVACAPLGGARYLVCDWTIAEQVWLWAKDGAEVGTIIDQLVLSEAS